MKPSPRMWRVYSGTDGESHVAEVPLAMKPFVDVEGAHGETSPMHAASGIVFRVAPPGYVLDWHCAPRRQYSISLSGTAEIEVGDGTVVRVEPGDVVLAEDLTGRGHITRVVGSEPRCYALVPLVDQERSVSMPRLTPVTGKSDVPVEHHGVVDAVVKVFGNVRGPFSMLLHSPKLAERLLPLVTFFRDESVVATPLRSIAVLTAVREREAAYPWAAQVNLARRNGIREEVIDVIRTKADPSKLAEDERDVVVYARQLMRGNRVDQTLFDTLNSRHGAPWMVEVTTAALYFAMVAGIANAFEIAPPPDGDKLPA